MKKFIKSIPVIGPLVSTINRKIKGTPEFSSTAQYWEERYQRKGNSGAGSYNKLAQFKGEIINDFVNTKGIKTVIEFGCGDGNQLKYFQFEQYHGFDISPTAVNHCRNLYASDRFKKFDVTPDYEGQKANLVMSLDVIYHLIEDSVFDQYMHLLFDASEAFVIVYSSDFDEKKGNHVSHVRHRKFTNWVKINAPDFQLDSHIPNKYPYNGDGEVSSMADFYIFHKTPQTAIHTP